jgi:Ca2+-binding EF-hand superfamily protein
MQNTANAASFSEIDSNNDKWISQDELATHQQQMMSQRSPKVRGQLPTTGPGIGMGRNMPTFADFDLNNDGQMTEDEFIEARGQRIANRVKQGYMMRGLQNMQPFNSIDLDQNGTVNSAEFSNMQMQHRQSRLK